MPDPINRVNFSITPFPSTQWSGDVFQLAQLIADHLNGDLDNSVFSGQLGGNEPLTDVGIWLHFDIWHHWDGNAGKYVPFPLAAGLLFEDVVRYTTLVAQAETNIVLLLPETGGTLARLEDLGMSGLSGPTETMGSTIAAGEVPSPGSTVNLDAQENTLFLIIDDDITITGGDDWADKKTFDLWVQTSPNLGTAPVITWPATFRFPVGGAALQTTDSTHFAVNHFRITSIGGTIYVEPQGEFQVLATEDTTPPGIVSVRSKAGTSVVVVKFNELVRGINKDNYIVKKDGVSNPILSASSNGYNVTLHVTDPFPLGSTGTVQYTGSTPPLTGDLFNNNVVAFGPVSIDVIGG